MKNYWIKFIHLTFKEWTRAKDIAKLKGHNKIVDAISIRESLLTSRAKVCNQLMNQLVTLILTI